MNIPDLTCYNLFHFLNQEFDVKKYVSFETQISWYSAY